ncbi:MAG: type II toxin-antitoxin system VapC family toxin [Planctomycetes bacterium]|nr:type II toxin-antitoxin system VapC family toxin [Planctomycetota bacterium]
MNWLVDANVLSEVTKPAPDPRVTDWLARHESHLVVNPVVLGEIRFGILLLPAGARRRKLEDWFQEGVARVNCLAWDAATGLRWAQLLADLRRAGEAMPVKDSLIAATALQHGLTVATRNVRDFRKAKVKVLDPFA